MSPRAEMARGRGGRWCKTLSSRRVVPLGMAAALSLGVIALIILAAYLLPEALPAVLTALEPMKRFMGDAPWQRSVRAAQTRPQLPCEWVSPDLSELHAQVVTIARAPARSERLLSQLSSQGINHEVFHGVDGLEDIPSSLMEVYGGKQTLQALRDGHRRFLVKDHWVGMAERRANGTLPSDKRKGSLFLRMQLAAKLSFLSVFHKMVSRRWEYMLVFEDDAGLVPEFAGKLREALCKLPDNFDVLYLSACFETTGPAIRPGIVQYRGGSCTLGFVASLPFALRTLHKEAFRRTDDPFDHVAMKQASHGRSFITDPKLLTFPVGIKSELRG